jgi:hypothetical protein
MNHKEAQPHQPYPFIPNYYLLTLIYYLLTIIY